MRRTAPTLVLALAAATACSSDGPTGTDGDAPMSATIDGNAWHAATTPGATYATRIGTNNILSVTGTSTGLRSVNLTVQNVTGPGTYSLTGPGLGAVSDGLGAGTLTWMSSMPGGSGTVTVTTLNAERVTGTFEFTALPAAGTAATGTVRVTSGRFDLRWTGPSGL